MRSHVTTHTRCRGQVRIPRIGTVSLSQHRPARERSAARIQRTTANALDSSEAQAFNLPNGLVLRHFTQEELNFLWREVHDDRVYLRHGVALWPGDVVVDVGANTGLFTLLAAEAVGPHGRVVSLEPLPATFALLQHNVASHAQWCADRGVQACRPVLLQCGAGPLGQTSATFVTYSKNASGWSTMRPDDSELAANMELFMDNMMAGRAGNGAETGTGAEGPAAVVAQRRQAPALPEPFLARAARALWRLPVLRPMLRAAAATYVRGMLGGQHRTTCALVPLGEVLRGQGLDRVDLLKVDVERAELEVLAGLQGDQEWGCVRQVVMEVHDLPMQQEGEGEGPEQGPAGGGAGGQGQQAADEAGEGDEVASAGRQGGRLRHVVGLLRSRGFSRVVVQQEAELRGTTIYNVYAVRG